MGAMGSCTEMTVDMRPADNTLLPGLPIFDVGIYSHLRLDSAVCEGDGDWNLSACYWLECISVLVLLAFFIREFYHTARRAAEYDEIHVTTSDFAAMVDGLEEGTIVDDEPGKPGLTSRLMGDLDSLGFTTQQIVQVEVVRECKAELKAVAELAALRNQRQELQAERVRRSQKSPKETPKRTKGESRASRRAEKLKEAAHTLEHAAHKTEWVHEQVEKKLQHDIQEAEMRLSSMIQHSDKSTGHAFVIFKEEGMRNEFIKRTRKPTLAQRFVFGFVRCVGVARCEAEGKRLHMAQLVQKLGKHTEDFEHYSGQRRRLVFTSVASGARCINADVAPEPSDVFWANFELSKCDRISWKLANGMILVFLAATSAAALVAATFYTEAASSSHAVESDGDEVAVQTVRGMLSLAASFVSVFTNEMFTAVALPLSRKAGPTSRTGFERNIFTMLAFFFLINTSVTPFAVATIESFRTGHMTTSDLMFDPTTDVLFDPSGKNRLVYQAWFDSGGVVNNVFFLLLGSIGSFAVSQMMPAKALLNRYVLARAADSQHRLNELWRPPDMDVGENYAKLLKAVSLAIIYAPLFPPLYLLAAAYLLVSFYASKFGIAHWFARPPHMSDDLNQNMRTWLAFTVALSLVLKRCAMAHFSAGVPLFVSAVAWAVYMLLYEVLAKTIRKEADLDHLDTGGTVFHDHPNMDIYVCPKLSNAKTKKTDIGKWMGRARSQAPLGGAPRNAHTVEPRQVSLAEVARDKQKARAETPEFLLKLELRLDGAVATFPKQAFQVRLCAFLKVDEKAVLKLQLSAGSVVVNAVVTMPDEDMLVAVGKRLGDTDLNKLSKQLDQQACPPPPPSPLPCSRLPCPATPRHILPPILVTNLDVVRA